MKNKETVDKANVEKKRGQKEEEKKRKEKKKRKKEKEKRKEKRAEMIGPATCEHQRRSI